VNHVSLLSASTNWSSTSQVRIACVYNVFLGAMDSLLARRQLWNYRVVPLAEPVMIDVLLCSFGFRNKVWFGSYFLHLLFYCL
jgi:hypothetical protein